MALNGFCSHVLCFVRYFFDVEVNALKKKKIIVAGMGHGGLAAAALLAQAGMDVQVFEQKGEGTLGYDWTDIFDPKALGVAGIPMPPKGQYSYKENMTFYSPSMRVGLRQHVPAGQREIKMERRDIYELLLRHAAACGAHLHYEHKALAPILSGSRVVGIATDKGDFYADLVIDACGMDSPVRGNLPKFIPIEKTVAREDYITIYRAFFDRASAEPVQDPFQVILFADHICGISWIATEENHTDLLIGRFEDFDMAEVERFADFLRRDHPQLGRTIQRGGQFVRIPVRQPLSLMVWDGYAAIGDSAFMTVPLIGSGIANSLRAARYLADTVLADTAGRFDCQTLWSYERRYFHELGRGLAPLAAAKKLLLKMDSADIDYFFESGILNEDNITMTADFHRLFDLIHLSLPDLKKKGKGLCRNPAAAGKILSAVPKISAAMAISAALPATWNERTVSCWIKRYEACFR